MTEFTEVADLEEVPPGERKRVEVNSELITLFNIDGELFAIYDRCLHKKNHSSRTRNLKWSWGKMPQSRIPFRS